MNLDESRLFRELDPPPGGADRFRRRLEERCEAVPVRGRRIAIAGLAMSVLVLFVVIALIPPTEDTQPQVAGAEAEPWVTGVYQAPEFDRLLGRPMQPAGFSISIDGKSPSVSEIRSTNEKVRIYVVEAD